MTVLLIIMYQAFIIDWVTFVTLTLLFRMLSCCYV